MTAEKLPEIKECFIGDVFILPDGETYIWRSRQAKLCLEMTSKKSTLDLLQQEIIRIYKEKPYAYIGASRATTAISHVNGGLRQMGWQIRCSSQKTEDGKFENRLGFVKVPTSSPARRSPKV